jgi:hypothetical protein
MSRLTEALLAGSAFSAGQTQPMLDPTYGGQEGWAPRYTQWISNQAYVRRNVICIVLEAPKFFQFMPNPTVWVQVLKSLMETQTRTIEGLNATLEVETQDHPIGGSGEVQHEYTNVKRTPSEPVITFVEKYGIPITTFFYNWITYGLMDAESKYPSVITLSGAKLTDYLADMYSMTCLFIEPDPIHQHVMRAWITANMFPRTSGEIEAKRDMTEEGEQLILSIPFTGLSQFGLGVDIMAQQILDSINLTNANPYLRPGFIQNISSTVNAANLNGYRTGAEALGSEAVPI